MNKIKATKKEMRKNYKILGVGYCSMQCLLSYISPIAYSCGINGWSCDYYSVNGVIISTGYDPIKSKNMTTDYKLINEYNNRAKEANTKEDVYLLLLDLLDKLEIKK